MTPNRLDGAGTPIEHIRYPLPHGIVLSCRAAGPVDAPVLVFLHGFPEAAFVWDELLAHFAARYRCIAPNLRGYADSSSPAEVEAYRVKHLLSDLSALVAAVSPGRPLEALVAHDWGGAVAWNFAVQHPGALKRLAIINSPHPATFLRELQANPAQQAASAYMGFLCRPDAQALLTENDFARLWPFFNNMGAADAARPGGGWLTEAVKQQYRAVWRQGMNGALNYYRASPLRPPTAPDDAVMRLQFAPEFVTVRLPTLVLWAEDDIALPIGLLDGLEAFVPHMTLVKVPGATHWIVHEQPARVATEIDAFLAS
jgi:epoxide hydrolase 4